MFNLYLQKRKSVKFLFYRKCLGQSFANIREHLRVFSKDQPKHPYLKTDFTELSAYLH